MVVALSGHNFGLQENRCAIFPKSDKKQNSKNKMRKGKKRIQNNVCKRPAQTQSHEHHRHYDWNSGISEAMIVWIAESKRLTCVAFHWFANARSWSWWWVCYFTQNEIFACNNSCILFISMHLWLLQCYLHFDVVAVLFLWAFGLVSLNEQIAFEHQLFFLSIILSSSTITISHRSRKYLWLFTYWSHCVGMTVITMIALWIICAIVGCHFDNIAMPIWNSFSKMVIAYIFFPSFCFFSVCRKTTIANDVIVSRTVNRIRSFCGWMTVETFWFGRRGISLNWSRILSFDLQRKYKSNIHKQHRLVLIIYNNNVIGGQQQLGQEPGQRGTPTTNNDINKSNGTLSLIYATTNGACAAVAVAVVVAAAACCNCKLQTQYYFVWMSKSPETNSICNSSSSANGYFVHFTVQKLNNNWPVVNLLPLRNDSYDIGFGVQNFSVI